MATTLGLHIILACFGSALPSIVLLAEFIGLRPGNQIAMRLARRTRGRGVWSLSVPWRQVPQLPLRGDR